MKRKLNNRNAALPQGEIGSSAEIQEVGELLPHDLIPHLPKSLGDAAGLLSKTFTGETFIEYLLWSQTLGQTIETQQRLRHSAVAPLEPCPIQ